MVERMGILILIVGLCLFVSFVIWIIYFMKMQEEESNLLGKVFSTTEETPEPVWEDGGEIFIGNVQKNKSRKKWRIFVYN